MRTFVRILLSLLAALPLAAAAIDSPHAGLTSALGSNCQACHQLHNAVSQSLIPGVTISEACVTCHGTPSAYGTGASLGFPWVSGDQATYGVSGAHHRWSGPAVNAAVGTSLPNDPEMLKRIVAGGVECSACHDQHASNQAFAPRSVHLSISVGVATAETNVGGGTGTMTLLSVGSNVIARAYRVQVTGAGLLAVSHDNGLTWFRPTATNGSTWAADTTPPAGGAYATGSSFQLDDPALAVQFAGAPATGDYWAFYAAYPFLRAANGSGEMCLACHQDRALSHAQIEGGGNGTRLFSHPVGQTLNANLKGYDRAAPLDADGGVPGVNGDANPTNDLQLGPTGLVGCTSCHAPHNADSNSLTVDQR